MDSKTDAQLTGDVYAAIETASTASVVDLGVIADDGHVTLDGTAATQAAKDAAGAAASRVAGVQRVTNAIVVDPEALGIRDDEQIRVDVHRALELDSLVPLRAISVVVVDGVVTLTGALNDHFQRELAEDDTRQVAGVRSVVNLITATPGGEV
jgi:osmotically-inducible protein OsmY